MMAFIDGISDQLLPTDPELISRVRGMELDLNATERLLKSVLVMRTNKHGEYTRDLQGIFEQNGLSISTLDEDDLNNELGRATAKFTGKPILETVQFGIDFIPDGNMSRTLTDLSKTIIGAVNAFEDFITLVDNDAIAKPDIIVGVTNECMAHFARRAAFKLAGECYGQPLVIATYDGLCTAIQNFDPNIRACLTRRAERPALTTIS